MSDEVCLITGVGPGTGAALVRKFAERYQVAMLARNAERLDELSREVPDAHAFLCDVADTISLESTLASIRSELGAPSVLIHNAVDAAFGDIFTIEPSQLERNFQVNTMALLHLVRAFGPNMVEAGRGTILATGNTSAHRGSENFAGFAPTKAAQRILMESAARALGPKGVHVAYVTIDAVIDVPWTREFFSDKPDDYFCKPADIAAECFHVAHQPRSAWSFDVIIRPFGEKW
jgi:NAD(P)-dependent dehydrogenase (short-subunit alcohol dehydrogenase family)